jgi:hypothetical protein
MIDDSKKTVTSHNGHWLSPEENCWTLIAATRKETQETTAITIFDFRVQKSKL